MTEKQFQRELTAMRRLLATVLEEQYEDEATWRAVYVKVAHKANLSEQTVQRLLEGETKSPHFRTVCKICHAVGLPALSAWMADYQPPRLLRTRAA